MPLACSNHPRARADFTCFECHGPICEECIRTRDDGVIVCPACLAGEIPLADEPRGGAAPEPAVPSGPPEYPCMGHPEVPAVIGCSVCRGLVCATCDFVFDDLHLCPNCAVLAGDKMTPDRRKMGLWSMGLGFAVFPIIGILAAIYLAAAGANDEDAANVIGILIILFGGVALGTSIMGFLLGIYSLERKSVNPWYIWFGTVCNGLVGVFCLLAAGATILSAMMQ
jgi:hypothetical protein